MSKRLGLTGASGVLGRRLVHELARSGIDIDVFPGDVRDAAAVRGWVKGLDAVIHAAAVVPLQTVKDRLGDAIATNVGGTANLANAVAQSGNCHLTYISTSHVYAPKGSPITEEDMTRPTSFYGLTKLQGEEWVRLLVDKHLIIRIFSFFDSRQQPPFLVPSLCKRILASTPGARLEVRGAYSKRDIIDGHWIAQVCSKLISSRQVGTINCGAGREYTVLEIAQRLAQSFNRSDISWQPADETHGDTLVANASELTNRLGELPPADLTAALGNCVAELSQGEKAA